MKTVKTKIQDEIISVAKKTKNKTPKQNKTMTHQTVPELF